jgi:hypothetical protein
MLPKRGRDLGLTEVTRGSGEKLRNFINGKCFTTNVSKGVAKKVTVENRERGSKKSRFLET